MIVTIREILPALLRANPIMHSRYLARVWKKQGDTTSGTEGESIHHDGARHLKDGRFRSSAPLERT